MKLLSRWGKCAIMIFGISILISGVGFAQDDYQKQLEKHKQDSLRIAKENAEKLKLKEEENKLNAIKKAINDGNTLVKTKQWAHALAAYNKAIELDPEGFPKAYYGKGLALKNTRKPAEALQAYQKAVQIDPNYADAHLAMAMLYSQLKQYPYALTACQNAARADSSNYKIFYTMGNIYNRQKKYAAAAKAFKKVTELKPKYSRGYEAYGVALENSGNTNNAITAYQQAIGIKPNAVTYYRLAALYNKLGRHSDALKAADASLKLKTRNNGGAAFEAGMACQQMGQMQKAISYYRKAAGDRRWKANADYQINLINRKTGN